MVKCEHFWEMSRWWQADHKIYTEFYCRNCLEHIIIERDIRKQQCQEQKQ